MKYDPVDFEKASKASDEELYAIIGYQNINELGGSIPSIENLVENGKNWYKVNITNITLGICKSKILSKISDGDNFTIEACILLADYFIDKSIDVPIVPVVTLIIKSGVKNICNDNI